MTTHGSTCVTATESTTLNPARNLDRAVRKPRSFIVLYGDEIGMKTTPPTRKEDVKDPVGVTGWPKDKGRDGERTPMQWDASTNAGFSKGTPWLPVPPTYTTVNVKAQESDPNSLLAWYRSLIELKKTNPVMASGSNVVLDPENAKVLSWMRQAEGAPAIVIAANFTADPQTVNLTTGSAGLKAGKVKTLLKSPGGKDRLRSKPSNWGPLVSTLARSNEDLSRRSNLSGSPIAGTCSLSVIVATCRGVGASFNEGCQRPGSPCGNRPLQCSTDSRKQAARNELHSGARPGNDEFASHSFR